MGCTKVAVEPAASLTPEVTVAKPESRQVTEFFEYIGRTASPEFVEIRSRVSGYLMKIHFSDGKEVKAGEPLFEIDRRPYEFALLNARARLQQAESQLKLANITLDRSKTLNNTNSISQQELDEATQRQVSATAEINSGKSAVAQAELDLSFCDIEAPISGRISRASVTVGNLIQAGQANVEPLTSIASVDPIHVLFDVDEIAVLKFMALRRSQGEDVKFTNVRELNQKVQVALANETAFPHEGILDFIDNRVRTTTGTLMVRAELPNQNRIFAPGLFVRVRVPYGNAQDALLVSERAILNDQSLKYVLVVGEDDKVERRDVELGNLELGMRVIKSGITAQDRVIINGLQRARPGAKVIPTLSDASKTTPTNSKE
jgi:RND family efflux transporter MFP subunit